MADWNQVINDHAIAFATKNPTAAQIAQYNDDILAYKIKYGHWPTGKDGKQFYITTIGARPGDDKTATDQLYLKDPSDINMLEEAGGKKWDYTKDKLIKHTMEDGSVYYMTEQGDTTISFTDIEQYSGVGVRDNNIDYTPGPRHKPPPKDVPKTDDSSSINWEYVGIAGAVVVGVGLLAVALS